ncbi:hypothetical protein LCGC14_3054360, partial [marine sediment metagenome]
EIEVSYLEEMEREGKFRGELSAGNITQDEFYEQLYGDPNEPDDITKALNNLGYKYTGTAEWLGIAASRYENDRTGHAIEIWYAGDAGYYGQYTAAEEKQLPIDDAARRKLFQVRLDIFYDSSDALAEQVFTGQFQYLIGNCP